MSFLRLISIASCVLLVAKPTLSGSLVSFILFITLIQMHSRGVIKTNNGFNLSLAVRIIILAVPLYLNFYGRWEPSSKVRTIAGTWGINAGDFISAIWTVLFFCAVFELGNIICSVTYLYRTAFLEAKSVSSNTKFDIQYLMFLIVLAVFCITFLSKSSFFYPLNDWTDANIFFTVGKTLLKGKILYKDVYEQKGPIIYVLHALAAQIAYHSFLGIYLFEIIACVFFLFFSSKVILCFTQSTYVKIAIPFICAVTYSSTAFCHGDSVEEFFLPLLTYSLYIGIQICLTNIVNMKSVFVTGLVTGVILWTKYTCLGFYIGWIMVLTVYILKQRRVKEVIKAGFCYCGGVVVVTIPIVVYFAANNALLDLYRAYFYNNTHLYSKNNYGNFLELSGHVAKGILQAFRNDTILGVIIIVFIILLNGYCNRAVYALVLVTLFTSCFLFIGSENHTYYSLVFFSYLSVGLVFPVVWMGFCGIKRCRLPSVAVAVFSLLCLVVASYNSSNTYLLLENKRNLPQYKFAEIISEQKDATLLNYGFLDGGFYTVTGIVPEYKYFCKFNIELEEMIEAQDVYVEEGRADFIVTRDEQLISDKYVLIKESEFFYEWKSYLYRLYKLI